MNSVPSTAEQLATKLDRALGPLVKGLEMALSILMMTLVVVTFTQVVLRYGFNRSLFWAEEFIRFNFTWIILLSAAYGTEKRAHFAVDAVSRFLPALGRRAIAILASLVVLGVALFFLYYGVQFSLHNWDQQSSIMRVPMTVVYASIPSAAVIMVIASLRNLMALLAGSLEGVQSIEAEG